MRKPPITKTILKTRLPKESRLGQAKRLGIAEPTLRRAERTNSAPANPHVRAAFLAALGLPVSAK